ncbi:MAG: hypothetical protein JWP21_1861 [Tardiphaga sp.]|nr:hypothetical protein [Tardiphaga sp.]
MSEPLLEAGQHRLLVAALDEDHAGCRQAGLRNGRREQISTGEAPQNLAFGPTGDPSCEQGRSGTMDRAVAATGHLVQGADG